MTVLFGRIPEYYAMRPLLEDIKWFSYPLYKINDNNEFVAIGTAILVWNSVHPYLVTAAHVLNIRSESLEEKLFIFRKTKTNELGNESDFIPISGFVRSTISQNNERDNLDIAVVRLDMELVRYSALQILNESVVSLTAAHKPQITFLNGYPEGHNEIKYSKGSDKSHSNTCINYYWGSPYIFDMNRTSFYEANTHIASIYEPEIKGENVIKKSPQPAGLSGGGLWSTTGYYENTNLKLEGIIISKISIEGDMIVFATRMSQVYKLMNNKLENHSFIMR